MTPFTKPVQRVTHGSYSTAYRKPRQIVVRLEAGDLMTFREKGRRQRWTAPVDVLMRQTIQMHALHAAARKREARKNESA